MYRRNQLQPNPFETVSTFIGLALPVLQFFFSFLPEGTKKIFLFQDYFFIVSLITAVIAYLAIIAVKSRAWFALPLRPLKNKKYARYLHRTNPNVYSIEEIQDYLKEQKTEMKQPLALNPNTTPFISIAPILLLFAGFFAIGLFADQSNKILVLAQIVIYITLVVITAIALAIQYIYEENKKKSEEKERSFTQDVLNLSYEARAFEELPDINCLAQFEIDFSRRGVLFKVGKNYYLITTDREARKLLTVDRYKSLEEVQKAAAQQ